MVISPLQKDHTGQLLWVKSKIIGDITTDSAIIAGEVKGNIEAVDFLELHSTSIVYGDIVYGTLEIHSGAIINGTLKKNINKKNNNKRD